MSLHDVAAIDATDEESFSGPLDLAGLLVPFDGPTPAGPSVRDDDIYQQLQNARRAENATLPQGVWKRDLKRADWRVVAELAITILETKSKDLQVAAWLIEAQIHLFGMSPLAQGFSLISGLCEKFWPHLYPELDPRDPSSRNTPFDWLNDKLPVLLQQIPLTGSDGAHEQSFSWTDYVNAQRHEIVRQRDPKSAGKAEDGGRVTIEAFREAVAQTPIGRVQAAFQDLTLASLSLGQLQNRLDALAGRDSPSFVGLAAMLEELTAWSRAVLIERRAWPIAPPPVQVQTVKDISSSNLNETGSDSVNEDLSAEGLKDPTREKTMPTTINQGPIVSREDAYEWLGRAADYLAIAEPHSPVPYLVRRAIDWGHMPLHELLPELTRGRGDLSLFMELLGIDVKR